MSNNLDSITGTGSTFSLHGYFGKLPSRGDFMGKGLPQSFLKPWDTWLQSIISNTQTELGSQWRQFYLTCPAYRFILSPGTCGKQTWMGVMIPSVDKVGRYYPMMVCRSLIDNPNPLMAISENEKWFTVAESVVLSCLNENFSIDKFDLEIEQLELQTNNVKDSANTNNSATNKQHIVQQHPDNAWRTTSAKRDELKNYAPLMDVLLQKYCLSYSVWWTAGSDEISPSLVISQGLPPLKGTSSLLDGKWDKWGWQDNRFMDCFLT